MFGGFVTVALLVGAQNTGANIWVVNAAMLVPGAVTALLVPSSRRRWYRWVTILSLAQIINPWATAPFLLVAVSWALWRSWSVERPARARKPARAAHLSFMTQLSTTAMRERTPKATP
jgi:branched-subunit amino acid ABC-type transport system permease component